MLTIEQLEQGKVYITVDKNPDYVFLCEGNCNTVHYFYKASTGKFPSYHTAGWLSSVGNPSFNHYEEATQEDAQWLQACIEAGKGVEKPKFKQPYEIY